MLALIGIIFIFVFFLLLHTLMLRIAFKWVAKSKPKFRSLLLAAATSLLVLGGMNAFVSALLGGQPAPLLALLCLLVGVCLVAIILRALLKDPQV